MIASLIGLGVSLAAGGWKAAQESKANKRYQAQRDKALAQDNAQTNAFYARQFYENPLTRSDNAAMLNHMQQKLKEATDRATATAAITGATPEAIQAQKNAAANAYAKTVGDIAASNQTHKDQVANSWQRAQQSIRQQYNQNLLSDYQTKMGNLQKFGELSSQLGNASLQSMIGTDTTATTSTAGYGDNSIAGAGKTHKLKVGTKKTGTDD